MSTETTTTPDSRIPSQKVAFNFEDTKPDVSTFMSRFQHFLKVTDPELFFVGDSEIRSSVGTYRQFEK